MSSPSMEDQAMRVASEIANCSMTPGRRKVVSTRHLQEALDTCLGREHQCGAVQQEYSTSHLCNLKLLRLLSRFSRVRLCVTPETAAHQAPPSLGFSRQEHWVGCHFLLQCMKVKSESEVAQSCPTLSDSMDCSPPGSSVHGIFQARVLEWGAIAFSRITLIPLWKTN